MKLDYIEEILVKEIGENRWQHSLRVKDTALELAQIHGGVDLDKLVTASLLHDCAKFGRERILKKAQEFAIILSEEMQVNPALIHGPLGAKIAQEKFDIRDQEILDAITYHTSARPAMSQLEKFVFLADYIEPGRDNPDLEEVRILAKENLDQAILLALDQTLSFLIKEGRLISMDSIKARNYYLEKIKGERRI